MPLFYFDLTNGVIEENVDGIELETWKEARVEAVRLGGDLIRENAEDLLREGEISVKVSDRARNFVCSVRIQLFEEIGQALEERRLAEKEAKKSP